MKQVADIARAVMIEMGYGTLTVGDNGCLDRIAFRCDKELGTTLRRITPGKVPEHYQTRIIDALANTKRGKELFEKKWTRGGGRRGRVLARLMVLKNSDSEDG